MTIKEFLEKGVITTTDAKENLKLIKEGNDFWNDHDTFGLDSVGSEGWTYAYVDKTKTILVIIIAADHMAGESKEWYYIFSDK